MDWSATEKICDACCRFFQRVKDGIRKFAMIIGKFFSLLAKWLDTAIKYVEATLIKNMQEFIRTFLSW